MKKRVLIAVALVLAVVLIAQTGVWAGKLQVGSEAPAAAPAEAGARPQGTVVGALPVADTVSVDCPDDAPDGAVCYTHTDVDSGDTFAYDHVMEVELGPDGGTVWYWNGSAWVELTVTDGKVTIPAGAPNPCWIAVKSN